MKDVILRVSSQQGRHAQSTRHRRPWARGRVLTLVALLLFFGGCATSCPTSYRLTQDFDSEPLDAVPLQFPNPTPPADNLIWTQQFLQPSVVARDSGGRWVRVQPKESYFSRGNAQALSAFSDFFKVPGANIRGHFSMRLVGTGHVVIALRAGQGPGGTQGGPLGGISVRSDAFNSSDVASLTDFDLSIAGEPFGTGLASYTPGQTLEFFWSIDQASRLLNLSVSPGDSRQLSFAISEDNVPKTPLQRLFLTIDVYDFSRGTTLFIDDVSVEEM